MFKLKGTNMLITRGDGGTLVLQWEGHTFISSDEVDVNIYREDCMNAAPIMTWTATSDSQHPAATDTHKYCNYTMDGDKITLEVLGSYTQLDTPITEPTNYWWEATCGDTTFICYDEQGPKYLYLYPGGID